MTSVSGCFFILLLNGCIFPEGYKVTAGREYSDDATAFLDLPGATRAETIASLGAPTWESTDARVLLYVWEKSFKWKFNPPSDVNDVHFGDHTWHARTAARRWGLFIAYDDKGLVSAHAVSEIGEKTLEEDCFKWSSHQQKQQ
jgi:hypothetical protein